MHRPNGGICAVPGIYCGCLEFAAPLVESEPAFGTGSANGGYYANSPTEDPRGPAGLKGGPHVIRGGTCDKPALVSYSAQRLPNRNASTMSGVRLLKEL